MVSAIVFTYVALVSEIKGRRSVLIHSGGIKAGVLFGPLCRLCLLNIRVPLFLRFIGELGLISCMIRISLVQVLLCGGVLIVSMSLSLVLINRITHGKS